MEKNHFCFLALFIILFSAACQKADDVVVTPRLSDQIKPVESFWWGDSTRYQTNYPTPKGLMTIPYASEILNYYKDDSIKKRETCANVFAGSSSIRLWSDLETCFNGKNVVRRGTGGSTINELLNYQAPFTIFKYQPQAVFIYSGENDIAAGAAPVDVATDFVKLYFYIRKTLPQTQIYYLSIKTSNSRIALKAKFEETNDRIKKFLDKSAKGQYLDVASCLLNKNGTPDDGFFGPDHLHLNAKGYDLWKPIIAPYLK